MRSTGIMHVLLFVFFAVIMSSCSSVQKGWNTDGSTIEKDLLLSKKNGLMLFTVSDTDPQSKDILNNVFTDTLFSNISKEFMFYNIDIVKDEKSADTVQLEKNYVLFSDYNITEVPYLCLMNKYGDIYHSAVVPQNIKTPSDFLTYLKGLKEKGKNVETLREGLTAINGPDKTKAIKAFFDQVYLVDSEKYRSLFEDGINNDPQNESGLLGTFVIGRMQLNIEPLLKQKKYNEIIAELNNVLETKLLSPDEEQGVLCNIAYFSSYLPNIKAAHIIKYLEDALKRAPDSFRAQSIKEDIEYLKSKN